SQRPLSGGRSFPPSLLPPGPRRIAHTSLSLSMPPHRVLRLRLVVVDEGATHVQIPSPVSGRRNAEHRIVEPRPCHKGQIHRPIRMEPHQTSHVCPVVVGERAAYIQIPSPVSGWRNAEHRFVAPNPPRKNRIHRPIRMESY